MTTIYEDVSVTRDWVEQIQVSIKVPNVTTKKPPASWNDATEEVPLIASAPTSKRRASIINCGQ
jgi:hypothetical protein